MTALRIAQDRQDRPAIDDIRVATPCDASWSAMSGDDKVRHCAACQKNVYNLSAMTEAEVVALIVATEGDFCGRIYRRADGSILTADCPVGVAERAYRRARRLFLSMCALVGGLVLGASALFGVGARRGCERGPDLVEQLGEVAPMDPRPRPLAPHRIDPPQAVMGDVAIAPPRLGKIAPPRR